jgi:hypothetical protein
MHSVRDLAVKDLDDLPDPIRIQTDRAGFGFRLEIHTEC